MTMTGLPDGPTTTLSQHAAGFVISKAIAPTSRKWLSSSDDLRVVVGVGPVLVVGVVEHAQGRG